MKSMKLKSVSVYGFFKTFYACLCLSYKAVDLQVGFIRIPSTGTQFCHLCLFGKRKLLLGTVDEGICHRKLDK